MNPNLLLLVLLVCASSYCLEARAIDDDIDNSIESDSGARSLSTDSLNARSLFSPEWIRFTKVPPAKMTQKFGTPLEISCEVMGSPLPIIQWVMGQMPLSEIEDAIESNVISETSTTDIAKVRSAHIIDHVLTQARTYTCVASIGSKTVYASTTIYPQADVSDLVRVGGKPFSSQMGPRIVYNEKTHLSFEGANVVLPCKVHARPKAQILWMKGEGNLIEQNQRYKLLPSGDLLITDLKWDDMGTFKCIARNALGKDTADTFLYPVKKDQ